MDAIDDIPSLPLMLAAVFNLNHPAHYVHWHFIDISVSNLLVIAAMVVVFVLAILLPFPRHKTTSSPPSDT